MAKEEKPQIVPFNGSSNYTILLQKELLSETAMKIDDHGNLIITVNAPEGSRTTDLRNPPGSSMDKPRQVKLTIKLNR